MLTGPLDLCRTGTSGGHTVGSLADSPMSPLLSDSTLDSQGYPGLPKTSRGVSRRFRRPHSSVCNVHLLFEPSSRVLTFRRRLAGSLILPIAYGIEVGSQESQFFANAQQAAYSLGAALPPGTFLMDWILLRTCPPERIHQS